MSTRDQQLPQDPIPIRRVNIFVTRDVAFNLEKLNKITAQVPRKTWM